MNNVNSADAEVRYYTLFEQSPDGIVVIDQDGGIVEFNEAAHKMLGYSREEFAKLKIADISLQSAPEIRACIDNLMTCGKSEFEVSFQSRNSGVRNIQVISRIISLSGKKVMHSIWRDITGLKQTEEALRKSERFIRDILETVDEGIIVIDREYRIISANKAYLDQSGSSMEKITGMHCYQVSHRTGKPCFEMGEECAVHHAFTTGEPHFAVHTHYARDGSPIYVETKAFPLKDSTGKTVSAIEIIHNTTEKKKLEMQLRHSQKMEAVGQLAGGIAHDFNNILTAIIGYGSLMKMRIGEDDQLRYYLQQMLDTSQRGAELTRGLLAFGRKQSINPRPTNLNVIIENMQILLGRFISQEIEMNTALTKENPTVMADCGQIEQVIVNLVTNARDAMQGPGSLAISTEIVRLDQEFIKMHGYGALGTYAMLSVADTGAGMDEKTKERIFEPFFTRKAVGKGTGLGLSIVYGIVKQHNGYIACHTEPGKGTTFKIYFPLCPQAAEPSAGQAKTAASYSLLGGTETVFIAEDDAAVRKVLKETLKQFGYGVIEAADGEEAMLRCRMSRDRIHLFILDVIMPKQNGKDLYKQILAAQPDAKVIFLSGYTSDILNNAEIQEGALNFVPKPVEPFDLLRKVREVLDRK